MPSAVPIFLKMADEKQVIYFTWPYQGMLIRYDAKYTNSYMAIYTNRTKLIQKRTTRIHLHKLCH